MLRSLILALGLIVGVSASAKNQTVTDVMVYATQKVMSGVVAEGLKFTKGDQAKYNMDVGGFLKGTMEMNVLDVLPEGVWIQQLMELSMVGKQDIRELIDPNTGEIKRLIVNGEEKTPPAPGDIEVIESKEDTITVPAGQFTCLYIKANVKNNEQASEVEQWMDAKNIPVMAMVKMVAQTQFGPMTAELTSFKRN